MWPDRTDLLFRPLENQTTDAPAQRAEKAALRAKFTAYELPADLGENDVFSADTRARQSHAPIPAHAAFTAATWAATLSRSGAWLGVSKVKETGQLIFAR